MKSIKTFLFLIIIANHSFGQFQVIGSWRPGDTSNVHLLYTQLGDTLVGRMLLKNDDVIVFLSKTDTLYFEKKTVKLVDLTGSAFRTPFHFENEMINERLFISPSGFALNKDEQEYRNIMLFYNSYHKGVTDRITIGYGAMPLIIANLAWVDGKYSVELSKNLHIAGGGFLGGGLVMSLSDDEQASSSGFVFGGATGVVTIGSDSRFINLSLSRVAAIQEGDYNSIPWMYNLGGAYKVGKRTRLFLEAGSPLGITLGVTTMLKRSSFDGCLVFFPGKNPRILPGFAYAKRF